MEQLSQYNQNLAVAKETTLPVQTTEERGLAKALADKRICHTDDNEFKYMMLYLYTLIGLRGENYPSGIEKDFVHAYIRENYGGHTIAEVRLAFTMAIQDKLGVDATAFEFFTTSYFSRIMEAYRKWAKEAVETIPVKLPEQKVIPTSDAEFIEACFNIYKKKLDYRQIPVLAYQVLESELNLSKADKERISKIIVDRFGNIETEKLRERSRQYAVKEFFDNKILSNEATK